MEFSDLSWFDVAGKLKRLASIGFMLRPLRGLPEKNNNAPMFHSCLKVIWIGPELFVFLLFLSLLSSRTNRLGVFFVWKVPVGSDVVYRETGRDQMERCPGRPSAIQLRNILTRPGILLHSSFARHGSTSGRAPMPQVAFSCHEPHGGCKHHHLV